MEDWDRAVKDLLCSSRFVSISRTLDIIEFHFVDADHREIALHVQCPCRVRHRDHILLGRDEGLRSAGRFDDKVKTFNEFLDRLPDLPEAQIVRIRAHSDLVIECSGGLMIETFLSSADRNEAWRVFRRGDVDSHVGYPPECI